MSEAEAYESFDAASRYFLHIPAEEFLRRFKTGDYHPPDNYPGVIEVLMLAPASVDI